MVDEEQRANPEESPHPVINIEGEGVSLGPLRRDLIPLYLCWTNDFVYTRTTADPGIVMTLEQQTATYERAIADDTSISFVIYERVGGRPIGTTALYNIDYRHRSAELSIGIGHAGDRGRGYGTEATKLLLDYAFTVLGLHSVLLYVYEFNQAGRRAYEKAGFRECGRRRQGHWLGGRYWDVIYLDCLATDFSSPSLGAIFAIHQVAP